MKKVPVSNLSDELEMLCCLMWQIYQVYYDLPVAELIYRSYDLLDKNVLSNPLNWSTDIAYLMLCRSPFHILGPIDESEEF